MIGCCKTKQGLSCICVWVDRQVSEGCARTPSDHRSIDNPGKKVHVVCFLISEFKLLLILAFLLHCCCALARSNSVVSENKSSCLPATFHLVKVVFEMFEKCICVEWSQCAIFHLSLTKLLQLLSRWRQDTLAWCGAEPWRLTCGCGMPWTPVYIVHLRPLHPYHEFSAERPGVMVMNVIWQYIYSLSWRGYCTLNVTLLN